MKLRKQDAVRQDMYTKLWAAIFTLTVLLTSCSYLIKSDPAASYSQTNYLSVEAEVCGRSYFGTGGCYLNEGQAGSTRGFVIQGLYKGEIEIFSENCSVQKKFRYGENEKVIISFADLLGHETLTREDSCTFRIQVSPDYVDKSTDAVFPRLGRFFLEVVPAGVQSLETNRAAQVMKSSGAIPSQEITLPVKEDGEFIFRACSEPREVRGPVVAGHATLPGFKKDESCKYQIAFATKTKKYLWAFLQNIHERNTNYLADPTITKRGRETCVLANQSIVSFVGIGDKWVNNHELCLDDVPAGTPVRTFTVKRNTLSRTK